MRMWGFTLEDAPGRKPRILERKSAEWQEVRYPIPSVSMNDWFDPPVVVIWYWQRMTIGDRCYGVWSKNGLPGHEERTRAVLALIDMNPEEADKCRLH